MRLLAIVLMCVVRQGASKLFMMSSYGDRNFIFRPWTGPLKSLLVGFLFDDVNGGFIINRANCQNEKVVADGLYFTANYDCEVSLKSEDIIKNGTSETDHFPNKETIANFMSATELPTVSLNYETSGAIVSIDRPANTCYVRCNDMSMEQSMHLFQACNSSSEVNVLRLADGATKAEYNRINKCFIKLENNKDAYTRLLVIIIADHERTPALFVPHRLHENYVVFHEFTEQTPAGAQIGYIDGGLECPPDQEYLSLPKEVPCVGPIVSRKQLNQSTSTDLQLEYGSTSYELISQPTSFCQNELNGMAIATGYSSDVPIRLDVALATGFGPADVLSYKLSKNSENPEFWGIYPSGNMYIKKSEIGNVQSKTYKVIIEAKNSTLALNCTANIEVTNDLAYERSRSTYRLDCRYYDINNTKTKSIFFVTYAVVYLCIAIFIPWEVPLN